MHIIIPMAHRSLNILKHVFSSDNDVSDRIYITSKEIIENNLEEFTAFAGEIGSSAGVKNFPVHIELRRDNSLTLLPIEVNPMRFGGWCSTPDLSFMAYGFNPYLYYFLQKKPNWSKVLDGKEGKLFSIIILDNSTGIDVDEIVSFPSPSTGLIYSVFFVTTCELGGCSGISILTQ